VRKLLSILLAAMLISTAVHATEKTMISLQSLQEMFASMKVKTKWNLDGNMVWGYFFTDPDPKKLRQAGDALVESGYHLVDIYLSDDKRTYVLHVEKIEHHTPETLNQRNLEFYKLADQFHLGSYDGMDVGPVDDQLSR
jgi:hypothetical protein